jgi:hypothetical protein
LAVNPFSIDDCRVSITGPASEAVDGSRFTADDPGSAPW